ncbi:MAG: preprotein translocase subunit YajC [Candidatus Nanopelagicales bacterium]|nr:preprotein translocase subunit YajC [Candidatus Nanopelagicales bacterium]
MPFVLLAVVFYFLILRPMQARKRAQASMQSGLVVGVRIMTTSGIFGTVIGVVDDIVRVEIAPGVVIELLGAAIARVIVPESAEAASTPDDLPEGEH